MATRQTEEKNHRALRLFYTTQTNGMELEKPRPEMLAAVQFLQC